MPVALRYVLFQIPAWIVAAAVLAIAAEFFGLARWIAFTGFALFVAKDAALFPFVRRSYEPASAPPHPVGETGVADGAIDAEGWVRVDRELWRARRVPGSAAIVAGARVRIVALRGLVLDVESTPDPPLPG